METGIIVLSAILIIIVASPFILMGISNTKHHSALARGMNTLLKCHSAIASKTSFFNNFVIAIDAHAQTLFFIKQREDETLEEFVVDLRLFNTCTIDQQVKHINTAKRHIDNIEKIDLLLTNFKTGATQRLELFNEDESLQLSGELAIAQEWNVFFQSFFKKEEVIEMPPALPKKTLDFSRIAVF